MYLFHSPFLEIVEVYVSHSVQDCKWIGGYWRRFKRNLTQVDNKENKKNILLQYKKVSKEGVKNHVSFIRGCIGPN